MRENKKIGVFGGLFDPPHIGHLIIAQSVLDEYDLHSIIFTPAGNPPHKRAYSPFDIRYRMTDLARKGNRYFKISAVEQGIIGKTYTIETIRKLKKYVRGIVYLIIGSDQWQEINTWKTPAALLKECRIIIAPRPNYRIYVPKHQLESVFVSNSPLINISSSMIRTKVKENSSIRYLVPETVYRYIKRKKLYR
jgi:nicotinate-nucleotide adenylyltransferase